MTQACCLNVNYNLIGIRGWWFDFIERKGRIDLGKLLSFHELSLRLVTTQVLSRPILSIDGSGQEWPQPDRGEHPDIQPGIDLRLATVTVKFMSNRDPNGHLITC